MKKKCPVKSGGDKYNVIGSCSHRTELNETGVLNIVNHIYTKMQIKITHGAGGTGSNAKHSPWFSFLTSALYKLHIFYLLTEATFTPNLRVALHCAPAWRSVGLFTLQLANSSPCDVNQAYDQQQKLVVETSWRFFQKVWATSARLHAFADRRSANGRHGEVQSASTAAVARVVNYDSERHSRFRHSQI